MYLAQFRRRQGPGLVDVVGTQVATSSFRPERTQVEGLKTLSSPWWSWSGFAEDRVATVRRCVRAQVGRREDPGGLARNGCVTRSYLYP